MVGTNEDSPRARRLASRRRRILDLALELAEAEGWEAVTTRRLADGIDFSQPVIYQHFAGRAEIIGAIALEGFAELEARVRAVRDPDGTEALVATCRAYLEFARERPRRYEAMFSQPSSLPFAADDTPPELAGAFAALVERVRAAAPSAEPEAAAELLWACCHGLATLHAAHRIPAARLERHLRALVASGLA